MRVFVVVAVKLLVLEALLAFACYAGYFWLGGGWPGTVLVLVVALLIVCPWIGDLTVDFDSAGGGKLKVRLSWWAAMQMKFKPQEARFRFLFITWRTRKVESRKSKVENGRAESGTRNVERGKRPSTLPAVGKNLGGLTRLVLAGLQALLTLLSEAKELRVSGQSPTEIAALDGFLAKAVQEREWGALGVELTSGGWRRIQVRYRIGIFRAWLTVLYAYLEGRPVRTIRGFQRARKAAAEMKEEE